MLSPTLDPSVQSRVLEAIEYLGEAEVSCLTFQNIPWAEGAVAGMRHIKVVGGTNGLCHALGVFGDGEYAVIELDAGCKVGFSKKK